MQHRGKPLKRDSFWLIFGVTVVVTVVLNQIEEWLGMSASASWWTGVVVFTLTMPFWLPRRSRRRSAEAPDHGTEEAQAEDQPGHRPGREADPAHRGAEDPHG